MNEMELIKKTKHSPDKFLVQYTVYPLFIINTDIDSSQAQKHYATPCLLTPPTSKVHHLRPTRRINMPRGL